MMRIEKVKSNISILFCFIALSGVFVGAQSKEVAKKKPVATAKKPVEVDKDRKPTSSVNGSLIGENKGYTGAALAGRLDSVLATLKITTCAMRIKQAVMALSDGQPTDFFIEPMSPFPNYATNVITIESTYLNQEPRYSILYVNPGCDGLYTQTITWQSPCDEVKNRFFPNFQADRVINSKVQSYRSGNNLQLSLIPADKKCVSVKKEMFR